MTADTAVRDELRLPFSGARLTTDRLVLEPLVPAEHVELADAAPADPRHSWEVRDRDEASEHVTRRTTGVLERDHDELVFRIALAGRDGGEDRPVGRMSLFVLDSAHGTLELGWAFHPAAYGHGFGAEAGDELLRVAFDEIGAHRVIAQLDPRNESSARILQEAGFRLEAHFVEDQRVHGEWADTDTYALLAREFAARALEL